MGRTRYDSMRFQKKLKNCTLTSIIEVIVSQVEDFDDVEQRKFCWGISLKRLALSDRYLLHPLCRERSKLAHSPLQAKILFTN